MKVVFLFFLSVKSCQGLSDPANGYINRYSGYPQQTYGSIWTFECNRGYSLSGAWSRRCRSDQTWSGSPTKCISKTSLIGWLLMNMLLNVGLKKYISARFFQTWTNRYLVIQQARVKHVNKPGTPPDHSQTGMADDGPSLALPPFSTGSNVSFGEERKKDVQCLIIIRYIETTYSILNLLRGSLHVARAL